MVFQVLKRARSHLELVIRMFVCFLLGVLRQVFISQVHPIWLAGMVLFFVLLITINLSFSVGPLFAICSFMVLVGGVLVVFGYSVSLVPVEIDQNRKFLGSSREDVVKIRFCFIFLILFLVRSKDYYFCSFFFSDCLYFGRS